MGTAAVLDDVEVVTGGVICRGVEETTADVEVGDDVIVEVGTEDDVEGMGSRGTSTVDTERKHKS